jgi:hypothetical protein
VIVAVSTWAKRFLAVDIPTNSRALSAVIRDMVRLYLILTQRQYLVVGSGV